MEVSSGELRLSRTDADLFVPDGDSVPAACGRVRTLVLGAHQDDVEFMAFPLIRDAFGTDAPTFGAVVLTNGSGSPRSGVYASCTDEQMCEIRVREQRLAASIGRYAVVVQLRHPSRDVREDGSGAVGRDLDELLRVMRPEVVMTHSLADKHDTHVGTALRVIEALRRLPPGRRPRRVLGGEIWRGLDWLPDAEKVRLNAAGNDALAAALMGVFDSQIAGGKRYDRATFGRRHANATYGDSHAVDELEQVALALDMTPLVEQSDLDPCDYVLGFVERFASELRASHGRSRVTPDGRAVG